MKTKTKKLHEQLFEAYNNGKEAAQRDYLPEIERLEKENAHLKETLAKSCEVRTMIENCALMQESCAKMIMSFNDHLRKSP